MRSPPRAELLAGRTLTRSELGLLLAERFPGRHTRRLAEAVELMVPLVHGPDTGAWGRWRNRSVTIGLAEEWMGAPMSAQPQRETLILRYLAGFGPASVADIQAWAGITRLAGVVDGMRANLRVFRDEQGRSCSTCPTCRWPTRIFLSRCAFCPPSTTHCSGTGTAAE